MTRWKQRVAGESGYTLPELLVGIIVGLLVAASAGTMVITAVQSQPSTTERAGQIQQGRTMLERISRELRQGQSIAAEPSPSPSRLQILTYVPTASCGGTGSGSAKPCLVTYSCGPTSCTRTEGNHDGSGTGTPELVASGITGPAVFCYAPWDGQGTCPSPSAAAPAYVAVRLVFPAKDGAEAVTLQDGAALRNYFDPDGG